MLSTLIAIAACLAIAWLAFVAALVVLRPGAGLTETARLLPDLLRMLGGMARDPAVPRTVRLRLWLVILYLMMPFDIIPDVIPVVGYADDAILVAWVIRSTLRRGGNEALARHWPGSTDGLELVTRLAAR
jgi:uncharacterized membrane protein YkvA (DUF1232 family)